jgi:hypothetical protein
MSSNRSCRILHEEKTCSIEHVETISLALAREGSGNGFSELAARLRAKLGKLCGSVEMLLGLTKRILEGNCYIQVRELE